MESDNSSFDPDLQDDPVNTPDEVKVWGDLSNTIGQFLTSVNTLIHKINGNAGDLYEKTKEFLLSNLSRILNGTAFLFASVGLIILVLTVVSLVCSDVGIALFSGFDDTISANVGEYIGGVVGTFFTIAAFIVVYNTLRVQQIEIKEIDKRSRLDRFEATFFNLIELQNRIADNIHINDDEISVKGRDIFPIMCDDHDKMKQYIGNKITAKMGMPQSITQMLASNAAEENYLKAKYLGTYNRTDIFNLLLEEMVSGQLPITSPTDENVYKILFLYWHVFITHYFDQLTHNICFIRDASEGIASKVQVKNYLNIVFTQLTIYEKRMLAIHAKYMSINHKDDLCSIMESYDIFDKIESALKWEANQAFRANFARSIREKKQ